MPDLRPGNRGIGVSAAVKGTNRQRGFAVLRETLSKLAVEDIVALAGAVLEPGAVLTLYRIERNSNPAPSSDPYQVVLESGGRQYRCPLYRFQARTQAVEAASEQGTPAREAVVV
jgi:hypothetical protein